MSFKVGIVGLPNVGKSTLFKALTKKQVLIANYPFATIDPNVGIAEVPDERLNQLAQVSQSEKIIPTTIEFYDIAGLVRGAYKGEGLGNQFLSHIRDVDAIAHVVRAFVDDNIIHVHGSPDPKNDAEVIGIELCMADLKTVERRFNEVEGKAKSGDKNAAALRDILGKVKDALGRGTWAGEVEATDEEQVLLRELNLLTLKPMMYVINDDENFSHRDTLPALEPHVLVSAKIESELSELPDAEAREMMQSLGIKQSGLEKLIVASYQLLDLITFFTSGPKETRAWTVRKGAKAPEAAGVIHSDFEKTFIRAEIIHWKDFVECKGEAGVKEKGLLRVEGKDYEMRDGDVCHFRVGV
ncbi:MAG: redox-regulated ATPase YchF [Patescibacteria group bacterium]